jgi:hypothetical protein
MTPDEKILQLVRRREQFRYLNMRCPKCSTRQVQLVDWRVQPAQWRCRTCKHRFDYEPGV